MIYFHSFDFVVGVAFPFIRYICDCWDSDIVGLFVISLILFIPIGDWLTGWNYFIESWECCSWFIPRPLGVY